MTYAYLKNYPSRGAQDLSATARKLAAMAMALLPTDLSTLTVSFTFNDFCKAIGYERGGESYQIFRAAVRECLQSLISIETEPDKNGKKDWKEFTWFTVAEFSEKTGQARMTFSSELAEFLAALKWMYAKINLKDLGELQSRYTLHLFEIAMSYRSLVGRGGNRSETWYFERGFPDLESGKISNLSDFCAICSVIVAVDYLIYSVFLRICESRVPDTLPVIIQIAPVLLLPYYPLLYYCSFSSLSPLKFMMLGRQLNFLKIF
jgi:hypothetical protein